MTFFYSRRRYSTFKYRRECKYCHRLGHTIFQCWKLHGLPRPSNQKNKGGGEGQTFQASNSDQEHQSSSIQLSFTMEQLDRLYKILESNTLSGSVAPKGTSALFSVSPSRAWIVDSGASDHMTGDSTLFSSYSPCAGNHKIKIADGSFSAIAGKGSVVLSPSLTLKDVLHVPNLSCSLMSVSKLAQDRNCQTNFFRTHCVFQDLNSGKMIGSAKESGGLYYFDIEPESQLPSKPISSCFESFLVLNNNNDDVMLWHSRLGHPSFPYLKHLFPELFRNKDLSLFKCEACEFAKHHRSHFPLQPYKPSKPFSVIHSDVWGPNRTSTLSHKKWFITFIDDHSRVCWVYLLKGKSDGGNLNEDSSQTEDMSFFNSFQTEDMSFFNNLSLPVSQSSKTYTSAPTKNGHDSLSNPTPVMSSELVESESTFSHEENNENLENNDNDDLIEMPQNNESYKDNRFEAGNKTWKGNVFVRKNHKESDESTSQHCHESEPGNDQLPKKRKGKSISVSESRILYPDIDDPVAVRKPVRSCTKYPLSNFISYSNLSSSFSAFTSKLSSVEIPKNVQVALEVPKWREAVLEEMKALEKNKTWSVMTLPDGKKTVGCKWVFTVKYNSDGSIERYKARLVAKGFTQTYGIDYSETFAPVAKLNTVRILLSLAANLDWPLHQLDVKNAFLNGDLEEEVYMDIPPGFEDKFGSNVCKLNKSLYGLKQSPRAWFEKFTYSMKKQGYIQGQADHTLFTKFSQDGKIAVLIVYVDDIVLTGDDIVEMARVKEKLALDFEIKDLGSMRYFLGMEVARSKDGIVVSQQKYILDLLKETGMSGCRPADTPMDPNAKLWEEGSVPVDTGRYQRLVGKLIYLSHTRPDIAFSVSVVQSLTEDQPPDIVPMFGVIL
ncbi:unnamed protein product [Trifolium pratense]|uniref:Uncharacterized protein n=1 Tax=Trifolium pratense TaxID=57577 RepID=A0ACB0K294_TRIPR|nr:unnamed protein product [Trifolium pratense]